MMRRWEEENNNQKSKEKTPKKKQGIDLDQKRKLFFEKPENLRFQEVNDQEIVEMIEVGEEEAKQQGNRVQEIETTQRQSRIFDETSLSPSRSLLSRGSIGYSHPIDREKMKAQMVQNRKIAERMSPWKKITEIQKKLKRQPARRKFSLVHGLLTEAPRRNASHHQLGRYLDESEATMTSPVRTSDDRLPVYSFESSKPASLQSFDQRKTL